MLEKAKRRQGDQGGSKKKRKSAKTPEENPVDLKKHVGLDSREASSDASLKRNPVKKEAHSCFLFKSEPHCFSIDDLAKEPEGVTCWDGVRNFQARNLMKNMELNAQVLYYHSNCKTPGVCGVAEVCRKAYPDHTAWDPKSEGYDPKSTQDNPRWFMVDIKFVRKLKRFISLPELKKYKEGPLKDMALFKLSRLSVQPVAKDEFDFILGLENEEELTGSGAKD